jgi:hypothetical protein
VTPLPKGEEPKALVFLKDIAEHRKGGHKKGSKRQRQEAEKTYRLSLGLSSKHYFNKEIQGGRSRKSAAYFLVSEHFEAEPNAED